MSECKINEWLRAGADARVGSQLFSELYPDNPMCKVLEARPLDFAAFLIKYFSKKVGSNLAVQRTTMRKQWTFLSSQNCPQELKILVADKITAYQSYVDAHRSLVDCVTLEQCYNTAKTIIDNFIEDYEIKRELDYYREHSCVLGKHRVFSEQRDIEELRRIPLHNLILEKERIDNNIWRVKDDIRKNLKPHLLLKRENRLKSYEILLAEINLIILKYG